MKWLVSYLKSLILGAIAVYATSIIFVLPKNPARWLETIKLISFWPIMLWCLLPTVLFPVWRWFLGRVANNRSVFVQSFIFVLLCLFAIVFVFSKSQSVSVPPRKWLKGFVAGLIASVAATLVSKMEFFEGPGEGAEMDAVPEPVAGPSPE